jgi:4'-phosphopantetheinyl transferase
MWQAYDSDSPPTVSRGEIFRFRFPDRMAEIASLVNYLSADERERLQGIKVESAAIRFLLTRATLRMLLGQRVGLEPRRISLCYGASGKPELTSPGPAFNVSHTEGWGLVALLPQGALGVDVEKYNEGHRLDAIARRRFSSQECDAVLSIADEQERLRAFFDIWTAKEACVKALGTGLGSTLNRFSVALGAPGALRPVTFADDPSEGGQWSVMALPMPEGWSAAVAVRGADGGADYLRLHPPVMRDIGPAFWRGAPGA